MKILNTIITITILTVVASNSAQATRSLHDLAGLSVTKNAVAAKLKTYNLPKFEKLQAKYFAQQFFNTGIELSQEEIFTLGGFTRDNIKYMAKTSADDAGLRKFSLKTLYNKMTAGHTEIADTLIEKGVNLGQVDLQALLFDVLRLRIEKDKHYSPEWLDWLLAHGADINEPSLHLEVSVLAIMYDNKEFLAWLWDNSETTTEEIDKLAPLAVLRGADQSWSWLSTHGANLKSLDQDLVLQTIMLKILLYEYLPHKKTLAESFVEYGGSYVSQDVLNNVLQATAEVSICPWSWASKIHEQDEYIAAMDKLLELGASIDALDLQELLYDYLNTSVSNRSLAEWAIKHGANINTLDLNNRLVESYIYHNRTSHTDPHKSSEDAIDAESFFVLLRELGLETERLDLPHLLSVAEEADRMLLEYAKKQGSEDVPPTTGYVEYLGHLQQEQ